MNPLTLLRDAGNALVGVSSTVPQRDDCQAIAERGHRQTLGVFVGATGGALTVMALATDDIMSWVQKTPPHLTGFILAAAAIGIPSVVRVSAALSAYNRRHVLRQMTKDTSHSPSVT